MTGMLMKSLIMLSVICFQSLAMAAHYDSVITGKGDPDADITAVQKAVDQGGSVLLKGVFDFGENGRVTISGDIDIHGETDEHGALVTKIRGGFWTFHAPLPTRLPATKPGPRVGIRNIHFEGALWAPISLPYCGGADIDNNKITNVRPKVSERPIFGKEGLFRKQGVILAPFYTLPDQYGKHQPGAITGKITIADNDIDLSADNPEMTVGQGVFITGATGADIRMLRNRVVNCTRNSLEALDNYPGEDGAGFVLIKDNVIITAEKGVPIPTPSTPNGIIAGWFFDPSGASDPARKTRLIITGNQIETKGETSIGIGVLADGAVIDSNHIILKGARAKGVFKSTSDATISNNKIEGTGLYAMSLRDFRSLHPRRNVIMHNDYTLFKASEADLFLQGSSNVVLDRKCTVMDQGQANIILE